MVAQLQQILRSRNNRFAFTVIAVLFTLLYITNSRPKLHKEDQTDNISRGIIKRLSFFEIKVDDMLTMFASIRNMSEPKRMTGLVINYIDANINAFWRDEVKNETLAEEIFIYYNNLTNHSTKLVTTTTCLHPVKLLVLINSHVSHTKKRNIIRETWGNDPRESMNRWRSLFILGRATKRYLLEQIQDEQKIHNDIILGDIPESSVNLSYKIEVGFEWSLKYCHYDYLLLTEDDSFVNMKGLFKYLKHPDVPSTELYTGNVQYEQHVDNAGERSVDREKYHKSLYPRYCTGGGFILSQDVVQNVFHLFPLVHRLPNVDAYMGELVLKAGIDATHNSHFIMFEIDNACEFNSDTIVHHPITSEQCMIQLHQQALRIRD